MGVVKNIMVRAGADFSAITKQANKAKTSMRGMQTSVSQSCSRMAAAANSMQKAFSAIGVTLSVAAVAAAGKAAKEAYDAQAEASAKLAQVMRNTMGARSSEIQSVENLIDAQERLGVVTGDVQTEAAQELSTYLTTAGSLKTLIPVLNDMVAQQYGIGASAESAVSIATMMGKVMGGQTSALSRYGYTFTAAQEAVLKYGDEAQRAATLAAVVEESVGGMNAALAATPNGRLQQVSNTLGKIQESFGQAVSSVSVLFIPALNAACGVLANLATLANKVAQSIANVFGREASGAAAAVTYTAAAAAGMSDLTAETVNAGEAAKKSLSTFGFDKLQKLSSTSVGAGTGASETDLPAAAGGEIAETAAEADEAVSSIGWLEAGLNKLKGTLSGLNFGPLTDALAALRDAAAPLTRGLFSGLSWAYDNLFEPLAKWTVEDVLPAFLRLLAAAAGVLSTALAALKPFASWLWDHFLKPIAAWTGGAVIAILNGMTTALRALQAVVGQFPALWAKAKSSCADAYNGFKTFWSDAGSWFSQYVAAPIRNAWTVSMTSLRQWGSDTWAAIKRVWGDASAWFDGHVMTPITNSVKVFGNGVLGFVEGLANGAISGINSIISALNRISFDIPDWVPVIGGNSWGFNLATFPHMTLPRLANGAVFEGNNPYLAIVNDQKHGVNIESPLSTIVDAMMIALRSASIGDNIQVNVKAVFDGQLAALARLLRPYIEADAKRVGNRASTVKGVV